MMAMRVRWRAAVMFGVTGACALLAAGSAWTASGGNNDELAAIQKAGVITIGVAQDPPFEFTTSSGQWTSFNPILDQKLAAYLGVKVKFVTTGWTGIVAGLQTGKYDIIGADINATPERAKVIDFTKPYYQTGTSFFVLPTNAKKFGSVKTLDDGGATVAVVTGSDNQTAVQQYLPKAKMRALPNASIASLVSEVVSGRSDALATSTYLAPALVAQYHFVVVPTLKSAPYGVLPVGVAWGIPKGQPRLLAKMNAFLAKETKSGDIARLQKQWLTPANSLK
jgi:polar amino acid transport system substrate-binding protein